MWQIKRFNQLTINELYDLLKLRIDVFVVEQTCYYPDLDDLDRHEETIHLMHYRDNALVAYCRILAPNVVYENESAIGRVVVASNYRHLKLGRELMQEALIQTKQHWPEHTCHISAQEHLKKFYQSLGFEQISEMYLEDDIPHIAMRKEFD